MANQIEVNQIAEFAGTVSLAVTLINFEGQLLCLSFYLERFYNSSWFFSTVYFDDSSMQKLYKVVKLSPINHFLLVEAVTKTAKYNIFLIT